MTPADRATAGETAVKLLLRADKTKALAVAVVIASSSLAGCTSAPHNKPCTVSGVTEPCAQPSGAETGWLSQPLWPAQEGEPHGPQGTHLATAEDFLANPQYTQLRAQASDDGDTGRPVYYGGTHSYYFNSSGDGTSGSSGASS